jgi:predicted lipoprotein
MSSYGLSGLWENTAFMPAIRFSTDTIDRLYHTEEFRMILNTDRADWAAKCLRTFADLTTNGHIDEDAIADLICDLGHYAELEMGLESQNVLRVFEVGIGAWLAESEHPYGDPDSNKLVTILIES